MSAACVETSIARIAGIVMRLSLSPLSRRSGHIITHMLGDAGGGRPDDNEWQ
jgi:hypothetical protein